jgi:PAS domain S-box-containing protein
VWEDGEFLLRRTRLDIDGERREVLTLLPAAEHPTPATLDRFAHEYALKDELDVAWAARPLALRRDGGHSILVREDPGGDLLETLLDRPTKLGLGVSLRIALGLAEAVAGLHRRGLIHKDIKPTHILVDPDSGAVRLTGFGLASRLPREQPAAVPPEMIAGTLAYMAPEQTGRMNRSVDARSDLYAVGVTLYRMFTGRLPFSASEPMEWVHCQIARSPAPPAERAPGVPPALSAMVMKLLAKAAEERYQTAAGLAADLRRCLSEWEAAGSIASFAPGALDFPDRLRIPEKLYGREGEVDRLLAAFERVVASGALELVLVSGYSGIGKSSVVNELHKALAPRRGLFACGKFDQSRTDVPYATLAQAVQILVRHILGESDAAIGRWRAALEEALGPNGRLMIDLVPQLKLVIGEPPPVPELPSQEAQRRFHLVVRRLLGVFARAEHPLVLFLDDLQWLDPATLDLLEDLLTQPELGHLLLIGAYRNNAVDAAHPLRRTLAAIGQAGARLHHITLAPLARDDLEQMVSDALRCDPAHSAPLADLVHAKTAGNPFFVIQFLSALAEEDLLRFEHGAARWGWDLARIEAKGYTDNVVELLVGRLHRLPLATRIALQQLACLGNHGSLRMLALVLGTVEAQVRADLWEAVRQELVLLLDGGCKFVHDRVQEAAYSLIPEASRAAEHLRIGRLLAAHTEPERRQEAIFEIVSQLNRGAALITEPGERVRLAELNLHAGQRAKASTAYATALAYLTTGAALLAKDRWSRQHELSFALELNRAECELLTGALKEAEERLAALVARAADTVEQATVAGLRIDLYMTLDRTGHAIEVGLDYLRLLGIEWSPHPTDEEARREYERIWLQLDGREIEELIDFPLMRDPALLATLDVLIKVATVAFFTDLNLHSLAPCRVVNLSLQRGNCDASCVAYVQLGLISGSRFGDYEGAYRFGRLSYDLVEKRGLKRFQARTYNNYAVHVLPFAHHLKVARELLRRSYEAANRNGDLTFAAYSSGNLNVNLLAAGEPLAEVEREAERGLALTRKMRFGLGADIIMSQLQLVRTLRGSTQKFGSFDDTQFDELQVESRFACNPDLQLAECWYWIRKVEARFLAGDYASAVAAVAAAQQLPWASLATLDGVKYHYYGALCRAAFHDSASPDEQRRNLGLLADHHRQLKVWAQRCPENFETRAALVGAEIARIEGRVLDAEHSYEQAIRSARANGFVHCEAVAYELAARFYKGRGFEEIARLYLQNARDGYLRWGADGKVRQLEDANPQIADEGPLPGPTSTILTPVGRLDLATVIRVSQALSAEIVLEKLLDTLMRTAIEQAGADRGLLILRSGADQRIAVEARTSGESVIVDKSGETVTSAKLPDSVLRFVMRTHESVILDEAVGENEFAADPYIRRQQPLSILCLPLINQGRIIGILYLENKLASHVFAPGRVLTLNLLASQAAISLENSRLYHDLEEREARIRRLVDANIIGIFFWEFEGRILEANDAFLKIIGYDRDDLEAGALRWTDLTPPDWRERDEQWVREHKATGLRPPIEKEYFRKDGSRAPILLAAATFDNSATEGVGFVVDLTERKRAEEALRQREAAIRGLADSNLLGIVAWEFPDTRIIEANDAFLRMVGYAREDLVANRLTLVDMTPAEWKSRAIQNGVFRESSG